MSQASATIAPFPTARLRRNRQDAWSRALVRENALTVNDLIWPIFVRHPDLTPHVPTMPGAPRVTVDEVVSHVRVAVDLGINAVMLFPAILDTQKCPEGAQALNPHNLVCEATRRLKQAFPDLGVIVDVALDPYTSHGHDGLFMNDDVENDATVAVLCQQALILAQAGVDAVSPSDMMDGRIGAIRQTLDAHGFQRVRIISYSAKYASSYYGPFRDVLGSKKALGTKGKATYQLDPANGDEALRKTAQDIQEGADMVIVKPGLPYLDMVHRIKNAFRVPTFAYQVSGEYAMIKAAAAAGMVDEQKLTLETLLSFKRAGADAIITYGACTAAQWLQE